MVKVLKRHSSSRDGGDSRRCRKTGEIRVDAEKRGRFASMPIYGGDWRTLRKTWIFRDGETLGF